MRPKLELYVENKTFCVDSVVYFGTSVHTVDESSGLVQITLILSNQLSSEITVTVTDEPGNATSKL